MRKCTIQMVTDAVNRLAPRRLAEDWDNPGLLIGDPSVEVKKIFVCLDVLDENISQAIELDAQLIVAHHPLIFHAIKNVRFDLPLGKKINRLIKNNLAVFAAHTNLDIAAGGVNDILAERIGLIDVKKRRIFNGASRHACNAYDGGGFCPSCQKGFERGKCSPNLRGRFSD